MRLRHVSIALALAVGLAACGGSASMPGSPTAAATTTPAPAGTSAMTGTWVGTAAESGGTTMGMSAGSMGMGMSGGSMGDMTWQLTQTDSGAFTGMVSFAGYHGGGQMSVTGTINGKTGTFTLTMPTGTMPMAGCSGQASGTFDLDTMMVVMRGSYAGATTCLGPFNNGQMSMNRK